jgi:antitoxin FitA
MPTITIRKVTPEIHRALHVRAAAHGRSAEAEIRVILEAAIQPAGRVMLGSLLAQIGKAAGGFEFQRDNKPAEPISFE